MGAEAESFGRHHKEIIKKKTATADAMNKMLFQLIM